MADITKCNDEQCSKRLSCFRFTAPANEYLQSYFVNTPRKDDKCEMYWGKQNEYTMKQIKDILNNN